MAWSNRRLTAWRQHRVEETTWSRGVTEETNWRQHRYNTRSSIAWSNRRLTGGSIGSSMAWQETNRRQHRGLQCRNNRRLTGGSMEYIVAW